MHVQQSIAERLQEYCRNEVELSTYTDRVEVHRGMATRDVYVYVAPVRPKYEKVAMMLFEEDVEKQLLSEHSFRRNRTFEITSKQVSFGEFVGTSRCMVTNELLKKHHVAFGGGLMLGDSVEYPLQTRIYVRTVPDNYLLSRLSIGVGRPLVQVSLGWRDQRRVRKSLKVN